MVALTVVLRAPTSTAYLNTVRARSKTRLPPAWRVTNAAPSRPASVLPMAMRKAAGTECRASRLTAIAPVRMAGHTRVPSSRNAATAMPAGAHTADVLTLTSASWSDRTPAAKYTAASPTSCASCTAGLTGAVNFASLTCLDSMCDRVPGRKTRCS